MALSAKAWKILGVLALVGVLGGVLAYVGYRPEREMTALMQQVAEVVEREFKDKLPRVRKIDRMLILIPGRSPRPEERQFREQLLDTVVRSDKYSLITWDEVEERLRGKQWTRILTELGMMPGEVPQTLEAAKQAMKQLDRANLEIDGVLFIEVTEFYEGDDEDGFGAKIGVKGTVWSRAEGAVVAEVPPIVEAIDSRWDLRYLQHAMGRQSLFWRLPLWLLLVCGLPWGLIQVVRAVLKRRSNGLNAALLATFTLFDIALAWPLLLGFGVGPGSLVGLIFVLLVAGYYNYDALDYIERRLL
ncbi:MAG: hypothetical protein D6731_10820 [Planctomycetota bacterium]|nr:MAG: hypothetical protein D6731_10820 [Planctomycetota bacterium]